MGFPTETEYSYLYSTDDASTEENAECAQSKNVCAGFREHTDALLLTQMA